MWQGGVRVVLPDESGKILLVRQKHDTGEIWMLPGGAIDEGETSQDAAIREVMEETGIIIHIERLLWHVEEASAERGQRFVNFFLGRAIGGKPELGEDPELGDAQVLDGIGFFSRAEIAAIDRLYPDFLRDELWDELEADGCRDSYRIRK
ncbi:MAG: NUDIX hydrolase [Clostridiales Family XIII bacterium]|jgi:ADP-ribose pyrophosphatase YjhB (NUDIX family)|nr:NUDIX hydrolase [Clostridiales Family XIII bacterium]